MDGVTCTAFENDPDAIQAARITTRDALDPAMNLEEVVYQVSGCVVRRSIREANFDILSTTAASWGVNTNINNLGYTDPQIAFDTLSSNLETSISTGDYTAGLVENGQDQGTNVLANADVSDPPAISTFTEETVSSPSDNGGSISTGILAAIIVSCSVVLIATAFTCYFVFLRNKAGTESSSRRTKKDDDFSLNGVVELDSVVTSPVARWADAKEKTGGSNFSGL